MKFKLISILTFFCIYLLTGISTSAQYQSTFEENIFKTLETGDISAYDFYNAINYNEKLYNKGKQEIDDFIQSLKDKKLQDKPLKKQVKTIYTLTHNRFLEKYNDKVFFNSIFENGNYNCVTASALYTIIFDAFNINYSIKETPTHIYLIADTTGLQTLIESTTPGLGTVSFNDKTKREFVAYLHANKIISDYEFNHKSTDDLFKEHYSKDASINKSQLAAIQYYNQGIFLMQDEKYSGAAISLKKARTIYPSNSIKFNHFAAIQNALYNDLLKKNFNGKLYGEVINASSEDSVQARTISDFFENVSAELCVNNPDIKRYEQFYYDINANADSALIPMDVRFKYHQLKGYYLGVHRNYTKALVQTERAYQINNENLQIKEMITEYASKKLFVEYDYKNQIDSMKLYFEKFPFLLENNVFQQQFTYYYMKVIGNAFQYNNPNEGKEYYSKFIKDFYTYKINHFSEDHINYGFINATAYYMSNNKNKLGVQTINQGLKIAPQSMALNQMNNEITKYQAYLRKPKQEEHIVVYKTDDEIFQDKVNDLFPGKWKAVSIVIEDMEQDLNSKEIFELDAEKNKNCLYTSNGKTQKGKWAYRPKSKCIYFVPNANKDNYLVFQIKEIEKGKVVMRPFKDRKKSSPYYYVLKAI